MKISNLMMVIKCISFGIWLLICTAPLGAQNVGINTTTPLAKLHVDLGASLSNGILFSGLDPSGGIFPSLGAGHRLMYYPGRAVFRAGYVDDTQWDNSQVGAFSFAFGYNTIAKGNGSTAFGDAAYAGGTISTAFGNSTSTKGYSSFVLGMYNDPLITGPDEDVETPKTPLLMVGNGDGNGTRNNALAVFKNGDVLFRNYSSVLEDPGIKMPPVTGPGTRMMWLAEKSAFRLGTVHNNDWDADSIGTWSTGIGYGTKAKGKYSLALGLKTTASGITSTALGSSTKALGENSISTGSFSTASGDGSTAMGSGTIASGAQSTVMGVESRAMGNISSASGLKNIAKGYASTVIGMYNDSILVTNQTAINPLTPVFIVGNGNGSGVGERSNAMVVRKDGNIGIGTSSPDSKLHINGAVKIADGTQGEGKVLMSDASGLARWQSPPPPQTYYNSISICCQTWMTKNLNVSTYRNGDTIPKVTSAAVWATLTTGAYCYFNNDSTTYAATYGKLYNWYAVNDPRGLAPEGWHIPSDFEWTTLGSCLGGSVDAGGPMKEINTTHWASPNTGASNLSGFSALPGGVRGINGDFFNNFLFGIWWSGTEKTTTNAWGTYVQYNSDEMTRYEDAKFFGFSVRCIKD